jgi:cadmium resistance protein CadD (predicted permease)
MHTQSIQGYLMGAVLGLALWLVAALATFYALGYLPRLLPYAWGLLGLLMILAAVRVVLACLRERPTTPLRLPRRS